MLLAETRGAAQHPTVLSTASQRSRAKTESLPYRPDRRQAGFDAELKPKQPAWALRMIDLLMFNSRLKGMCALKNKFLFGMQVPLPLGTKHSVRKHGCQLSTLGLDFSRVPGNAGAASPASQESAAIPWSRREIRQDTSPDARNSRFQ